MLAASAGVALPAKTVIERSEAESFRAIAMCRCFLSGARQRGAVDD
jgi:hypothetical protein